MSLTDATAARKKDQILNPKLPEDVAFFIGGSFFDVPLSSRVRFLPATFILSSARLNLHKSKNRYSCRVSDNCLFAPAPGAVFHRANCISPVELVSSHGFGLLHIMS